MTIKSLTTEKIKTTIMMAAAVSTSSFILDSHRFEPFIKNSPIQVRLRQMQESRHVIWKNIELHFLLVILTRWLCCFNKMNSFAKKYYKSIQKLKWTKNFVISVPYEATFAFTNISFYPPPCVHQTVMTKKKSLSRVHIHMLLDRKSGIEIL